MLGLLVRIALPKPSDSNKICLRLSPPVPVFSGYDIAPGIDLFRSTDRFIEGSLVLTHAHGPRELPPSNS